MGTNKRQHFIEKLGLFGFKVYFYVNYTDEELFRHLEKIKPITDYDKSQLKMDGEEAYNYRTEQGLQIIRLKKWTNSIEDIGILTHEILHAVLDLLDHAGIRLSDTSEETYTYALEDLLVKALKKLK